MQKGLTMNPIYRFYLEINGVKQLAHPLYGSDLIKSYSREARQMFFREQLKGKLRFVKSDYAFIMSEPFDSIVYVYVEKSNNGGTSWSEYFNGKFTQTDCLVDIDNQIVEVELTTVDDYENLLAGLDKEFNLIELAPEIVPVTVTKRSAIQVYTDGDSVLTTFRGPLYFEQEVTPVVVNNGEGNIGGALTDMGFQFQKTLDTINLVAVQGGNSAADGSYVNWGYTSGAISYPKIGDTNYKIRWQVTGTSNIGAETTVELIYAPTGAVIGTTKRAELLSPNTTYYMTANTSGQGKVIYAWSYTETYIYARLVHDKDTISGFTVYDIGPDDITEGNTTYKKASPVDIKGCLLYSTIFSSSPTEWGLYESGKYFDKPAGYANTDLLPVGRALWLNTSIWINPAQSRYAQQIDLGQKAYTLKHAYPIHSCINALLKKVAPNLIHDIFDSQFLYSDVNPISGDYFRVLLTQNTNILKGDYDQPAQKALITLGQIFDMLRDCFQCYYYIEGRHLKIEHYSFFRAGLSYEEALVGTDLTNTISKRTNLPADYGLSKYSFIKEDMPEWYQFSWADDVSSPFKGYPIEILSNYAKKGNIKEVRVSNFVSDIDLMLLNPGAFSEDGMTLLMATLVEGYLQLPIITKYIAHTPFKLQNGYASFCDLQEKYYKNSLPAKRVKLNKTEITVLPTPNRKQEVRVPTPIDDPDVYKLIRTSLGDGQINDIEINLSSRIAKITLLHDTE